MCIIAQSTEFWLYFILVAAGGPRYEIKLEISFRFSQQIDFKLYYFFIASFIAHSFHVLPDERFDL